MTRNEIREVLMQMRNNEMDAAKTLDLETARKLAGEKLPGKNLERSLQILSRDHRASGRDRWIHQCTQSILEDQQDAEGGSCNHAPCSG